jgi:uncharacterized membrane protein
MLIRRGPHREAFTWWMAVAAATLYLPVGVYMLATVGLPAQGVPFVLGTSLVHAFYFTLLGRAYEHGDLSFVYPIARGTGPLLAPAIAIPLLGERLSPLGAIGIAAIVVGIVTLQMGGFTPGALTRLRVALAHPAARYASLTGVTIALYSVVDKGGVGVGGVHPILYGYLLFVGGSSLSSVYFWTRRRAALVACWRSDWRTILIAGALSPLAYWLALFAFQLGQVSYLAPMREISIVIASLLGAMALREGFSAGRLASAGLTTLGVVLIGLGA